MAFLDSSTAVIDAILTRKGRELLARNDGSFQITKFAFGDDEINYQLYDATKATDQDADILNLPVLEPVSNENVALLYSHWVGWHFEYKNFDCNIWKNREDIFREAIKLECKVHGIHYIFPSLIAPAASFLN